MAWVRASVITLICGMIDSNRRTRKIRRARRIESEPLDGNKAMPTIIKSKIFQPFLKNDNP